MNRTQAQSLFAAMCEAVDPDATQAQVERLTSWALENFGTDDYAVVETIAAYHGVSELITEFSMRRGESGL